MKYCEIAKRTEQCMGCKKPNDGTIVLAHRNLNCWGTLAGKSTKTLSLLGAFLCHECHAYGDGEGRTDTQWWEYAVHRTITWAWQQGYIRFGSGFVEEKDMRLR